MPIEPKSLSSPMFAENNDLPLSGLRVLDLTLNIAGPFATMILGDLGADVTKVERPPLGDDARRMVPTNGDASAYFLAINRNKHSVMLDFARRHLAPEVLFSHQHVGRLCDQLAARQPRRIWPHLRARA